MAKKKEVVEEENVPSWEDSVENRLSVVEELLHAVMETKYVKGRVKVEGVVMVEEEEEGSEEEKAEE